MKIVLATHNKNKCIEMTDLLCKLPIELLSLDHFPEIGEIKEDGNSLKENALIKARAVHSITKLPSWADDTGLEVDALDKKPGVFSARYAGESCSYSDNVNKLLKNMLNIPLDKRQACFRTTIAFVSKKMELIAEGLVKGMITTKPKGFGGFGYDPVFYIQDKNKTYSEMTMEEKNQISHRGQAIHKMIKLLKPHFPTIFHQMEDIA